MTITAHLTRPGSSCHLSSPAAVPPRSPWVWRCTRLHVRKPLKLCARASAAGQAGHGHADAAGSGASRAEVTIRHLDDMLGIEDEEQQSAPQPPQYSEAPQEQPQQPAVPTLAQYPEWAQLPAEELKRREALLWRRQVLCQKERALQDEYNQHARKLAWHQQRLAMLQQQFSHLAAQQQSVQEALDPEGTAALRQREEQLRRREMVQAVLLLSGFMIALVAMEGLGVYFIAHKLHHVRDVMEMVPPHC